MCTWNCQKCSQSRETQADCSFWQPFWPMMMMLGCCCCCYYYNNVVVTRIKLFPADRLDLFNVLLHDYSLTSDLENLLQQCPVTRRMFVPRLIQIPPMSRDTASCKLGVNKTNNGRMDGQCTDGRPDGQSKTWCSLAGGNIKLTKRLESASKWLKTHTSDHFFQKTSLETFGPCCIWPTVLISDRIMTM